MGPAVVIEVLTLGQFLVEVHVIGVAQKLVKFVLVGSVRRSTLPLSLGVLGLI
jgi:hypothetical protein